MNKLTIVQFKSLFLKNPILISSIIIGSIFLTRFIVGGFDPSYFILAGRYSDKNELIHDLRLFKGGYDGQFYYRYAINPFNKDIKNERINKDFKLVRSFDRYGIRITDPIYRRSRVLYPFSAWLLALGQVDWVPYTLILVNILAFIFLIKIYKEIVRCLDAPPLRAYTPLLIGGLYLAVARDLAEVLLCTLLAWCYLCYLKKKYAWFLVVSTLLLLCKEISIAFIGPAYAILFLQNLRKDLSLREWVNKISLVLPWLVYMCWKLFIISLYPTDSFDFLASVNLHFKFPFVGIIRSMKFDADIIKALFIFWGFLLIAICLWEILKSRYFQANNWMFWMVGINLFFLCSYSNAIYIDMWSFLRVLSPTYLCCFLFLLERKFDFPKWLIGYNVVMASLAILLVIIAP